MDSQKKHIKKLLNDYQEDQASLKEVNDLLTMLRDPQSESQVAASIQQELEMAEPAGDLDLARWGGVLQRIHQQKQPAPKLRKRKLWLWSGSVAAAVATILFGLYFFNFRAQDEHLVVGINEVKPAQGGITLLLANGKRINLSNAANGKLADEAGISISKTANGEVMYELGGAGAHGDQINTLTTGRGETYKLKLSDGSMIWLNSTSSLTYSPGLLKGGRREVQLKGEGYFEIAKDAEHPFVVRSRGQELLVLGTHFNVNSYDDEPAVVTTLLEGRVKVNANGRTATLAPGQQAVQSVAGLSLKQVDTEASIAWKNSQYLFEGEHIQSIMRVIARWYDVDVVYQGEPVAATFSGGISRLENLSQVLKSLETTDKVQFKIEGRILYVMR